MNRTDQKQSAGLIADYFVRDLSVEELGRLQHVLENDTDARAQFAAAGRDEWLLHHVHHLENTPMVYFNPRRSRTRRIRAIAAAAAVIASLSTVFYAQKATISEMMASKPSAPVIARVSECFTLEGQAISVVNDGKVRKLSSNARIYSGDRVVIPPGCQLSFQYLEESTEIRLEGDSLVQVADNDGAKRIRLDRGRLFAEVAPQRKDKPLRVATRDAEVVVVGTSFEVFADELTRLSVLTGKVRFISRASGKSALVSSGCFAESSADSMTPRPYRLLHLNPVEDYTQNLTDDRFIAVDPVRNYKGFLTFDLGRVKGRILEAGLRLRVNAWKKDYGGEGDVRLFCKRYGNLQEAARFSGGIDKGKDLVLDINTKMLHSGVNSFVVTLDPGGNDFWFSSSRGSCPPVLELKVSESD